MSLDPYEALGVPRDAPTAEIKRAYRKRAKKAHPDGGGTSEAFEKISRSMLILTDPDRRAKYDATGDADDVAPDNSVAIAVSIIVGFISQAVSQFVAGASGDPCTVDLVELARKHLRKQIVDFENQKVPIVKAAATMERVEKRFRARKKSNPMLLLALRNQRQGTQEPLRQIDQKIQQFKDAIALLDGYDFISDTPATPTYQTVRIW